MVLFVLQEVISCVLILCPDPLQGCKLACQPNPALAQFGQEEACRLFHELTGKERDHLVNTHTHTHIITGIHADTQQMEGYFPWEESLCGVGRCPSCFICLRAFWLFLAHPANAHSLHKLVHTSFFRFSYLLLLWAPFMAQRRAISRESAPLGCQLVPVLCEMTTIWPQIGQPGGKQKVRISTYSSRFFCTHFFFLFQNSEMQVHGNTAGFFIV